MVKYECPEEERDTFLKEPNERELDDAKTGFYKSGKVNLIMFNKV